MIYISNYLFKNVKFLWYYCRQRDKRISRSEGVRWEEEISSPERKIKDYAINSILVTKWIDL